MPDADVDLAVVGAGPYGLAVAAYAQARGLQTAVFGRPMGFWRDHMPAGMLLRSGRDWHLDVAETDTLDRYLTERSPARVADAPIRLDEMLGYVDWFVERQRVVLHPALVSRTSVAADGVTLDLSGGGRVRARAVVAVPGIAAFADYPSWAEQVPAEQRSHTAHRVSFDHLAGARAVVIGGRQSAYEWAALMCEAGATSVEVVHRHAVPAFAPVDWGFVEAHLAATTADPGWWRGLDDRERTRIRDEFWAAGRLTLEPWLVPRLDPDRVRSRPSTTVVGVGREGGAVVLDLSDGARLLADEVVFATGYRADLDAVRYLRPATAGVEQRDGYPVLDERFGTSVAGLRITGFLATQDFGPFFGFVRGAVVAAQIIVDDVVRGVRGGRGGARGRP